MSRDICGTNSLASLWRAQHLICATIKDITKNLYFFGGPCGRYRFPGPSVPLENLEYYCSRGQMAFHRAALLLHLLCLLGLQQQWNSLILLGISDHCVESDYI